ncbi:unnamed protein product [Prorocentrum cordatum]|uniref:Photolyase/cryptochrome alpha/beta domain-containing protein n=1 Tax=Prorocentrum cordatum TaxID=2364126 RepID=A0ABN9T958_9DINO|nr:unnamed protein product [Polarella glacialis]
MTGVVSPRRLHASVNLGRVAELCKERGVRVEGFLTEELRERGVRVGFDVVELAGDGRRVALARVGGGSGPRVSKYVVTVAEFESLALPILDRILDTPPRDDVVCIIDEIGKMELFSSEFISRVRRLLESPPVPVLFTIALRGSGFIAEGARAAPGLRGRLTRRTRWQAKEVGTGAAAAGPGEEAPAADGGAGGQGGCVLVWLRSELRLGDSGLLERALELCRHRGASLLPVFCFDPGEFGSSSRSAFGSPRVGEARRCFVEEAVADLSQALARRGSRLVVCDASPEAVLASLAGPADVVLACAEACPEERAAEERVRQAVGNVGADLELIDGGGTTTIFGADDLRRAGLGEGPAFPEDFRVFYDAVKDNTGSGPPEAWESHARNGSDGPPKGILTVFWGILCEQGVPVTGVISDRCNALARLGSWLQGGGLRAYKGTFRRLLGDYSSRLSAPLALGCLSPRRLCAEALDASPRGGPHVEHFVYELCWRDFFRHAARRWAGSLFLRDGPLGQARGAAREWRRDAEAEDRWRRGALGVPLVDATLRELRATGYMGNLARQIAAAFLVEELRVDWRVGADWFEALLVDYDPHSNWGQWARSAGVVPTNEAKRGRVGGTRYLDLALGLDGGEAFRYVRSWVPELAALPDAELLAPWRAAGGAGPLQLKH